VRITKQPDAATSDGDASGLKDDSSQSDGHPAEFDENSGESNEDSAEGEEVEAPSAVEELDVRDRPPAQRHDAIFEAYESLDAGEGFVLVNDHDPKPLYHQFQSEAGPEFHWEYRAKDPGEFRVLVGKTENGAVAAEGEGENPEDAEAPF
jgi:uncharacterized protein (DUF2249 family)